MRTSFRFKRTEDETWVGYCTRTARLVDLEKQYLAFLSEVVSGLGFSKTRERGDGHFASHLRMEEFFVVERKSRDTRTTSHVER